MGIRDDRARTEASLVDEAASSPPSLVLGGCALAPRVGVRAAADAAGRVPRGFCGCAGCDSLAGGGALAREERSRGPTSICLRFR